MIDLLRGGDLRSIGASNSIVKQILRRPERLAELVRGISSEDPVVRARAADALEKVSAKRPEWLARHKQAILSAMCNEQQEVRWHIAQMIPRLSLTRAQRRNVVSWLAQSMDAESKIVGVCALTALVELAQSDVGLRPWTRRIVAKASASPVPSMRARAKRLQRTCVVNWQQRPHSS